MISLENVDVVLIHVPVGTVWTDRELVYIYDHPSVFTSSLHGQPCEMCVAISLAGDQLEGPLVSKVQQSDPVCHP